ncbi:MAG: PilZ domain-containing protein [Candidatus Omnitrophica bacterium]|nr:PilZ domain-containing protein [Candidatus Omnitrophota bacterium]
MWQGIDKRRFPRANYRCQVSVIRKAQKESFSTQTENIGAGGICVILSKDLGKFCLLEISLYLQDGLPAVECDARVVWVVESKDKFDTGIEFVNIKKTDVLRIEKVVEECLKTSSNSFHNGRA